MTGMNRYTGKAMSEMDHIRQSIADIITTPLGARVMRREYGSLVFELIDRPLNGAVLLQLYVCVYDAVTRWEQRVEMLSMSIADSARAGALQLRVELRHVSSGERYTDTVTVKGTA